MDYFNNLVILTIAILKVQWRWPNRMKRRNNWQTQPASTMEVAEVNETSERLTNPACKYNEGG